MMDFGLLLTRLRKREGLLGWGGLLLLLLLFWLPFGFTTTGMIEDWSFYAAFEFSTVVRETLMIIQDQPTRPFILLTWWLGHSLTPDSFAGLNFVNLLLLWGKGGILFNIIRRVIPGEPGLAFASAVLFICHPADRGIFLPRVMNYHMAVFAFLLAVWMLLIYWHRPRHWQLMVMGAAQLVCLGTLEVAYPLMLFVPLVLVFIDRRVSVRVMRITAWWYAVPALCGSVSVWLMMRKTNYTTRLMEGTEPEPSSMMGGLVSQTGRAYYRTFIEGWVEVFNPSITMPSYFGRAVVVGVMLFFIVWLLSRGVAKVEGKKGSVRACVLLLAIGLAFIPLGYMAFMLVPSHRLMTARVFLFSSIGGGIAAAALLWLASRCLPKPAIAFSVLCGAAGCIAAWGAFGQHYEMQRWSFACQKVLAEIVANVPSDTQDKTILIVGETGGLYKSENTFALATTHSLLESAVRYLYEEPTLDLGVVPPPSVQSIWIGFDHEGVIFPGIATNVKKVPYHKIILLNRDRLGTLTRLERMPVQYLPPGVTESLVCSPSSESLLPPPRRAYTLFKHWPFEVPASEAAPQSLVRVDFDKPVIGEGWSYPEGSVMWTNDKVVSMDLLLDPANQYEISFRVMAALAPDIVDSLSLWVNGVQLKLRMRRAPDGTLHGRARVSRSVVRRDRAQTLLEFRVNRVITPHSLGMGEDRRTLGMQFDWLEINPQLQDK